MKSLILAISLMIVLVFADQARDDADCCHALYREVFEVIGSENDLYECTRNTTYSTFVGIYLIGLSSQIEDIKTSYQNKYKECKDVKCKIQLCKDSDKELKSVQKYLNLYETEAKDEASDLFNECEKKYPDGMKAYESAVNNALNRKCAKS